jgi:hypothetical protein
MTRDWEIIAGLRVGRVKGILWPFALHRGYHAPGAWATSLLADALEDGEVTALPGQRGAPCRSPTKRKSTTKEGRAEKERLEALEKTAAEAGLKV